MTVSEDSQGQRCVVCQGAATQRVTTKFAVGRKLLGPEATEFPGTFDTWACDLHAGGTDMAPAGA